MKAVIDLLFQARTLKEIPRSGFHYLGSGRESVAEHSFLTAFIAYVMAVLDPEVDGRRLLSLCLLHDITEARIGDLNSVNKKYVSADETKALSDTVRSLPFGAEVAGLVEEFHEGRTREAALARDADQLSLLLELKTQADLGFSPPHQWIPHVRERIRTEMGKALAAQILERGWNQWWYQDFIDSQKGG